MQIKTLNGSFRFAVQRYETSAGSSHWLRLTDPALSEHHESPLLQAYAVRAATHVSYGRASLWVEERTGTARLSDQRVQGVVQETAAALTQAQAALVATPEVPAAAVHAVAVELYEAAAEEVVWLGDGVCVSEQKAVRDKQPKAGKERTTTDLAMFQRADGSYQTVVAGAGIDAVALQRTLLWQEYGTRAAQLPVVAISDGARSLKHEVQALFGGQVTHFLDGYHVEAKVHQLLSQIAPNKAVKEARTQTMLQALWQGRSAEACATLQAVTAKNGAKQAELLGYLQKNEAYLIDYEKRRQAGKVIGSGRMEKQNDVVVAQRQKRKGMSWSKQGSLSLAMVTAQLHSPMPARTNHLQ